MARANPPIVKAGGGKLSLEEYNALIDQVPHAKCTTHTPQQPASGMTTVQGGKVCNMAPAHTTQTGSQGVSVLCA